MKTKQFFIEPTYLRSIYDGLSASKLQKDNPANLPQGLIGIYEEALPPSENINERKKLLSKSWLEPMSYKQFSNLLAGKNKIYDILLERNGSADILKKTLIIIDEAHERKIQIDLLLYLLKNAIIKRKERKLNPLKLK
jgi:hypothetical protein